MSATAIFHTQGRRLTGQILNKAVVQTVTYSIGLRTLDGVSTHPSDAAVGDTLAATTTLAECTATGYARQTITNNSTNVVESLSGVDSLLTFAAKTFTFTGAQNGLTHAFLTDGTNLIASAPLSATRNVVSGDTIVETFQFTVSA
jgi:hypothetical protein